MSRETAITLSPKPQRLVQQRLASGRYRSAAKVVEEALCLLDLQDRAHEARIAAINAGIDRGRADVRAGRVSDFDEAAVERIKRRGRARLAAARRRKSAC